MAMTTPRRHPTGFGERAARQRNFSRPLTLELTPTFTLDCVDGMTVSELAGEVGISADTVRYYGRIGLLPEPERSPSGYRLYHQQDVERAKFVKRAQRLGLRLADIAGLADVWDRGLCPCGGTRRLLEARLSELDADLTS